MPNNDELQDLNAPIVIFGGGGDGGKSTMESGGGGGICINLPDSLPVGAAITIRNLGGTISLQDPIRAQRCGHNFPPRDCPYEVCGFRAALVSLDIAEHLNRQALCVYCGHVDELLPDRSDLSSKIAEHVRQCSKHPLNRVAEIVAAEVAELEASLANESARLNFVLDALYGEDSFAGAHVDDHWDYEAMDRDETTELRRAWRVAIDAVLKGNQMPDVNVDPSKDTAAPVQETAEASNDKVPSTPAPTSETASEPTE